MSELQGKQDLSKTIALVQQYIRQHLDKPLNRTMLADVVGYSVPHLHRIYTELVGETMSDTIRQLRLKRAGYKLRMGAVDITEVALTAGYQTHTAFSKAFKQQYGLRPSDFRDLSCNMATQLLMEGKAE